MNDKYQQFAEITAQIKELTEQKKAIEEAITAEVTESGGTVDLEFGKFTTATRTSWKYTDSLKEAVKGLQRNEQNNGLAEKQETSYLRFTPAKGD